MTARKALSLRIGSTFIWLLTSRILGAAGQAVAFVLLARDLNPARFGLVATVVGAGLALLGLSDLGLGSVVARSRALGTSPGTTATALRICDVSGIPLLIASLASLGAISLLGESSLWMLLPLSLWLVAERGADIWLSVATADGETGINVVSNLVRRLLSLPVYLVMVYLDIAPELAFSSSLALCSLAGYLATRLFLQSRVKCPHFVPWRYVVKEGWSFWVNAAMGQMRSIDVVIVNYVCGPSLAGIFAAPSRLVGPLRLLPGAIGTLLLPFYSRGRSSELRVVIRLAGAAICAFAIAILAMALLSKQVILATVGVQYLDAVPCMRLICIGVLFSGVAAILVGALQGLGFAAFVAKVSVASTGLILGGVLVGAYLLGPTGAAAGVAAGYLANMIVLFWKFVHVRASSRASIP